MRIDSHDAYRMKRHA